MEHVAGAGGSPGGVAATLPARELYSADHAHVRAVVNALEGTMEGRGTPDQSQAGPGEPPRDRFQHWQSDSK